MPLAPRGSKSVVASTLEREPITIPRYHWTTQDPLLDLEVIYGSGDLFRTGSAAGPGTIEEQWEVGRAQVRGMGPGPVNFARMIQGSQGTMGIATWVTVKCNLLPKVKRTVLVPAEKIEDLIDFTRGFLWKKLGGACLTLNAHNLASILCQDNKDVNAMRDALPPWVFICTIEGGGTMPEEKVEYQEAELMELAQHHGLKPATVLNSVRAEDVSKVLSMPSPEPYWKLRFKGGCHDIFFLTTVDRTPEFIDKMCELAGVYRYRLNDVGVYLQPTLQGTNCHCEFNLGYDPQNQAEVDKVKKFDADGSGALANMGGFFSRPYGSWKNVAYGHAAETVIALRKVKGIFDPKGIMNPGKLCF
jgi:FAD/FMN-containing dehydrogenase